MKHTNSQSDSHQGFRAMREMTETFKQRQDAYQLPRKSETQPSDSRRIPPELNSWKLNADAAWLENLPNHW